MLTYDQAVYYLTAKAVGTTRDTATSKELGPMQILARLRRRGYVSAVVADRIAKQFIRHQGV